MTTSLFSNLVPFRFISNLTQNVLYHVLHISNYLKNFVGLQTDMCDMV